MLRRAQPDGRNAVRLSPSLKEVAMPTRTSHSHITFRRPFRLAGMDAAAPAGSYKVNLEEERLDTLTVEAWRQTAVILQVTTAGITEHVTVGPQKLRDALLRDGDDTIDPAILPRPPKRELLRLRRS
jgi:hypothetical protein